MPRSVPAIAEAFVMRAEACRLTAYRDSAGVWTNGVGHTGPEVMPGLVITPGQAKIDLDADLAIAADRLAACVLEERLLALSDHQYAALISFVFNLGALPGWTIWKVLNAGDLAAVPDQMKRFDKARDPQTGQLVDVPGLMNRRLAEVALWNTPDVEAAVALVAAAPVQPPPSSTTRLAETPPTPNVVTPLHQSGRFVSSVATAAVALPAAALPAIQGASAGVKQVSDAIAPYAGQVPFAAHLQPVLLTLLASFAIATVVFEWFQHQHAKTA